MKEKLGSRIQHYRTLKGLSQPALAEALEVDKQTIYRWEKGRAWPRYEELEALSGHLGIAIENLFERIDAPPRETTPAEALEVLAREINKPKLALPPTASALVAAITATANDEAKMALVAGSVSAILGLDFGLKGIEQPKRPPNGKRGS